MTRRSRISILSLIILVMAMVAQFHHHEAEICVTDILQECHSCHLNPQTFVFTGRPPLSDVAVASSALPCRQDGGESLVPPPCDCKMMPDGAVSREYGGVIKAAAGSVRILRGPPHYAS